MPQKVTAYVPESEVFTKLVDFEKRLDATIIRKRNEIQEAALQSKTVN
jgi:SWI/SNF-related matrix-associated actin-dependent regulator of chromatin subfamily D